MRYLYIKINNTETTKIKATPDEAQDAINIIADHLCKCCDQKRTKAKDEIIVELDNKTITLALSID